MPIEMIPGVQILGELTPAYREILTKEAVSYITDLQRQFGPAWEALLRRRRERQQALSENPRLGFLSETAAIRDAHWTIGPMPTPSALLDRRVEITGPPERKMIINALNSGAQVFMADFEDACSPTWDNLIQGQINVRDALDRVISVETAERAYNLNEQVATLIVRPRGWHLVEKHMLVDGKPVSASLFDAGLYLFHNQEHYLGEDEAAYLYLPKLEDHLEARLWNEIFSYTLDTFSLPRGKIKATVLIETITAAFEMDEILYELREHVAGLNCGRWDYIFSVIKKFQAHPQFLLGDRNQVTMTCDFLRAYSRLLIKTCHRRRAYAIGGMAAQIPIKDDPAASEEAMAKVRADKEREARDGHDGTWVAHPGLVPVALEAFDRAMVESATLSGDMQHLGHTPGSQDPADIPEGESSNQMARCLDDVQINAEDLLHMPEVPCTEAGFRNNISVALQYLEAWLGGNGCVPLYHLMEDAATAEIARAQIWQWLRHGARLDNGQRVNRELFQRIFEEECDGIRRQLGEERYQSGHFDKAAEILIKLCTDEEFPEFLTLEAYEYL